VPDWPAREAEPLRCDIVTIFPEFFDSALATGLLGKAVERGLLDVRRHDLRDWAHDRHRTVDDAPFGGGAGMVMRPEPWFEALDDLLAEGPARVVLLAPDGRRFDQPSAGRFALLPRLVLCCGRYEGIDERVRQRVDEVLSIGDFVLAGGETAALVVLDAVARLLPGVMGNAASVTDESFAAGLLEYPQYTRPAVYRDLEVPEVLRSGNHGAISRWRREQAIRRTMMARPELLATAELTEEERARHGLAEGLGGPVG
jgi:tRNA (guanine37-N1)-methyltransferase